VKAFATDVRGNLSIENSLRWVLDVVFQEDASQIKIGHGPENVGFLKRFVTSLLKQDTSEEVCVANENAPLGTPISLKKL